MEEKIQSAINDFKEWIERAEAYNSQTGKKEESNHVKAMKISIKALEKQLEMLRYCDEHGCAGCKYRNPHSKENICMNDLIITI